MAKATREFVVIGLGRFGGGLAATLVGMGHEVLGVDADARIVQDLSGVLTHVVEADSTSEEAMRQLGVTEFSTAVVAIGTDLEASILTTGVLVDLGVERIVAKAVTEPHGRILKRDRRAPGRLPRARHGDPGGPQPRRLDPRLLRARPGLRARRVDRAARARGEDAGRRRGAQALRRHGRLHQAGGRRRSPTRRPRRWCRRATSSSSPARSGMPRPSASSPPS